MNLLQSYGLTDFFVEQSKMYEGLKLARVIAQYKGLYKIITEEGERLSQISGKLRYEIKELYKFPAVGDYVMASYDNLEDVSIIHNILTRKSVFLRKAVGVSEQSQVIASNINIVFICMSLNINYNLNRLERYLSISLESGATPVIVLTKSDLCEDLPKVISEVERVSCYCDVITTSMFDDNISKFKAYLKEGITTAFIGSSGVGKSTLINQILGEDNIRTNQVSTDDKGRHTTTARELFLCPFGGVVIDTPGMRELGIQSLDLSKSFNDIEDMSLLCKFNDCTHTSEPGCEVLKALDDGFIDKRRLDNYFKIKNESSYEGLNSRQIETQKFERMFKDVGGMKNARKFIKDKHKDY